MGGPKRVVKVVAIQFPYSPASKEGGFIINRPLKMKCRMLIAVSSIIVKLPKKEAYGESKLICLALSSQYPLIGIGIPRKLTVPTTLLSTMESMVSIPLIMDLPAIEASIPHTDGNGILTLAVFGIFKINLSLIILCMD